LKQQMVGRPVCLIVFFLCLLRPSQGWWDTGHMLVAQIALNTLGVEQTENVKDAISNALNDIETFYDTSSTFVTAACWMDDLKSRGSYLFADWHFINIPICDAGFEDVCETTSIPGMVANDDNVVFAINECISTLKSKYAGGFERGLALKLLLHLVGDLHQPLHAVNRFSTLTPNGDAGGNGVKLTYPGGISNLHQLWDSGVGLLNNSINRPLSADAQNYIAITAQYIQSQVDVTNITPGFNITEWAMEGVPLAEQYVYSLPSNGQPDDAYIAAAQPIVIQQIGTAGYRLAQLLQQILPCSTQTGNCPSSPVPTPSDLQGAASSISITFAFYFVLAIALLI